MERALASHQCDPGLIPARCHIWIEFVVGSQLTLKMFLWVLRFSSRPSKKTNTSNSNSTRMEHPSENQLRLSFSYIVIINFLP